MTMHLVLQPERCLMVGQDTSAKYLSDWLLSFRNGMPYISACRAVDAPTF
jgi:hypothetical protein